VLKQVIDKQCQTLDLASIYNTYLPFSRERFLKINKSQKLPPPPNKHFRGNSYVNLLKAYYQYCFLPAGSWRISQISRNEVEDSTQTSHKYPFGEYCWEDGRFWTRLVLVPTCPFLSVAQVNWGGRGVVCLLANGVCLILGKGRIGNIYPIRGRGTIQYTQDLQQDQDPSFISQDCQDHIRCTKDSKDLICCICGPQDVVFYTSDFKDVICWT
jgi:hypothetical protein